MENDINEILATKRAWRADERQKEDRRKKDGTSEQRKDCADVLRDARSKQRNHNSLCNCSMCEMIHARRMDSFWRRIWNKIVGSVWAIVFLMVLCSNAYAYTASWYGTTGDHTDPWKHTITANGEHFNENALTAASWAFPLGSYVRVTNVANGASVVVRINDRGPARRLYRVGRIIDLTRGSFEHIAPLSAGVIHVIVRIL